MLVSFHLQDGLYLVTNDPSVITGYPKAILTPNGGEFPIFYEKMVLSTIIENGCE